MTSHLSEEVLNLYLDRELPSGQLAEVQSHLAGCGVCRAALKELETVFDGLAAWKPVPLPLDFSRTVMSQLPPPPVVRTGPLVWAGLAFQVVLSLLLGVLILPGIAGSVLPNLTGLDFQPLWQTLRSLGNWFGALPEVFANSGSLLPGFSFGNINTASLVGIIVALGLGWLVLNRLLLKGSARQTEPTPLPTSQRR